MMHIIPKEVSDEWKKHPAKRYCRPPLGGIIESALSEEALEALIELRRKSADWTESKEASLQAARVDKLYEAANAERDKLFKMHQAAIGFEYAIFIGARNKK